MREISRSLPRSSSATPERGFGDHRPSDNLVARCGPCPFDVAAWKGQQVIRETFPGPGRAREHLAVGFGAQDNHGRFTVAAHYLRSAGQNRLNDGGKPVPDVLKRSHHDDLRVTAECSANKRREAGPCPLR